MMTREQFLEEITKRNNTKQSSRDQMLWFVAYHEAEELHEHSSIKDIAQMLLDGVTGIDEDEVDVFLECWFDPDAWDGEDPQEELIKELDKFYGVTK